MSSLHRSNIMFKEIQEIAYHFQRKYKIYFFMKRAKKKKKKKKKIGSVTLFKKKLYAKGTV